jgi:S-DNA-T family DNA segregation ATPase FtsK/SpoIIIE
MTYSLNTLNTPRGDAASPRAGVARFAHEIALVLGLVALVFWLLALISHSVQDAAWSTTGAGGGIRNWGGRLGALLADLSYFTLGFSVWWCFAAGVRAWMATLARWMRGNAPAPAMQPQRFSRTRTAFWIGLAVLLCASTALEWSRLYRFEPRLPGHAGGALGYLVGPTGVQWLGFTGSGLVFIALTVLGAALVFRFSWSHAAERVGAWIDGLIESRREKREVAEDLAVGQRAAREREEIVLEERIEIEEHHPTPLMIEPVLVDLPKSERVAKERQKPLFTELPDSKLPQVDLLDGPQGRQETVHPKRWR